MLEKALGLKAIGRLSEGGGFRFSRVDNINFLSPRSPVLVNNNNFLGGGRGLPGGGPEIVIDSLPTKDWPWKFDNG